MEGDEWKEESSSSAESLPDKVISILDQYYEIKTIEEGLEREIEVLGLEIKDDEEMLKNVKDRAGCVVDKDIIKEEEIVLSEKKDALEIKKQLVHNLETERVALEGELDLISNNDRVLELAIKQEMIKREKMKSIISAKGDVKKLEIQIKQTEDRCEGLKAEIASNRKMLDDIREQIRILSNELLKTKGIKAEEINQKLKQAELLRDKVLLSIDNDQGEMISLLESIGRLEKRIRDSER